MVGTSEQIYEQVKEYYGQILNSSDDLKTNAACCTTEAPPKYVSEVMPFIASEVIEKFYGCGSPIPPALEGITALDLGCGSGRDVYALSKLVGEQGCVIGVDMTSEQLVVAQKYQEAQARQFGYQESNIEFKTGYIENLTALGIEDASIDLVVSNCVINLSPFKEQVFSEIYRVLKPGGELYFSDVFADRRLPEELKNDPVVRGECLGGALYWEDFRRLMQQTGWKDFVTCTTNDIHVDDFSLQTKLGFVSFSSRTIRAIKAANLEDKEENYGQQATYNGGMAEMPRYFDFSDECRFIKNKPQVVSGNIATMLEQSRYGDYFEITPAVEHRGLFDYTQAKEASELRQGNKVVDLKHLEETEARLDVLSFEQRVGEPNLLQTTSTPSTMQVNICYQCNLGCRHCYLECGPKREEHMSRETMEHCLKAFEIGGFDTLDITGGAPELHPEFSWFLQEGAKRGDIIVRSNLTLLTKPKYEPLVELFVKTKAKVVASLPFYNGEGTDSQRGKGVFDQAVAAIKKLNEQGYGIDETLQLDLVYNVSGPYLPPPQELLQEAYEQVLQSEQGIVFNQLLAFNNYPLGRFALDLKDAGMFDQYFKLLVDNFNALAVTEMMCRNQVNVDFDGRIYDCECNHVLRLPVQYEGRDASIKDSTDSFLSTRRIRTSPICYSCSAGFGSSCGGSLV